MQAFVRLTCEVSDCTMEYKDGKLVITFEREVVYDPNATDEGEQMGEIQSNLLWECFDSSLELLEVRSKDQLQLVVDHHENTERKAVKFQTVILVSDEDLQDWADQQSGATIHEIQLVETEIGNFVHIVPLWRDNLTIENIVQYEQDFYDYFADRMQM
ncbi:MAG: hypothetical protein EO766_12215 [Hydrotalea sp. AMD]|uniref:hypothetical protein n=1 Tax=Hydrotalea sp. AMD TaxID=2501297 RepID=UPI001024FE51|nr:hypothetical protein [Hydrotalea sp. AMD]RWZ87282.1 MAG: hypothetical protein EO766_12215 [Hydrotalea sp. AMD]